MKKNSILFGLALLGATTAFVSCTNDNDDILNPVEEEGLTTITVGAPTIETEGSKTRVTFTYDNGLKMAWEAGDIIKCTGYRDKNDGNGWKAGYNNKQATAKTTGTTSEFTPDGWTDLSTYTHAYSILYGTSANKSREQFETASVPNEQTQAGNNNTEHLKANYWAYLKNVSTNSNITFSETWAENHAASKPIDEGDDCGQFIQSSCLKFDLKLPSTLTAITKVVLVGKSGNKLIQEKGGSGKDWTLNVTGLGAGDGFNAIKESGEPHFIGYVMLPPCDQTISVDSKWEVRVFYDGSNKIYKPFDVAANTKINAGTLAVIKMNSTGWKQ